MKLTALAAGLAAVCGVLVLVFQPFAQNDQVRGPTDVMGAFIYHLDRGNFGKACGLMTREAGGAIEDCSGGFVYNAGINMGLFGIDIFDGMVLLPGYREINDTTRVYRIKSDQLPPVDIRVVRQDSGRWRISRIG